MINNDKIIRFAKKLTMKTKVEFINEWRPDVSVICLMHEDSNTDKLLLTKTEQTYVQQSITNKKKLIQLNNYYRWLFFVVIDKDAELNSQAEKVRRQINTLFDTVKEEKINEVQLLNLTNEPVYVIACLESLLLSQYQFNKYLSKAEEKSFELETIYVSSETDKSELLRTQNIAKAVYFTRDLINEPANVLNTLALAERAEQMAAEHNIFVKVYHKAEIEAMGMGGLLAVNRGSVDPPVFIHLEYKPQQPKNSKPLVLVGKGITFDSGGLNIKPGDSMDGMKSDMSGAAAVLGILKAAAANQLPVHLVGLIPATDNRPGFNAFAPGDIIHMMDGSTVEMLNSDAEGRMILADALHFAKRFNPQLVIDIATLTGSASAAVGRNATVAFAKTDEQTYLMLEQAAFETWERIVRFPLWDDYADMLKSKIADLKNIGNRHAGAITAAKFLEHFTDYPWIHLDIAGPAFLNEKDSYRGVGATGVIVRMISRFLLKI